MKHVTLDIAKEVAYLALNGKLDEESIEIILEEEAKEEN